MPRPSRRKLTLLTAVAVPCLVLTGVWLARSSLGVWTVTDYLRRQGAPATITITRLTANGFAGSAVIGPPGDPDLVIDHIEADYALFPGFNLSPRVDEVRLSGVKLKAAFDGKKLQLGSLQRLVDQALAAPPGGPSPRVRFDGAVVRLATPAGNLVLTGQGLIDDGRVKRLALTGAAPRLTQGGVVLTDVRATLTATGTARLDGLLSVTADQARSGEMLARAVALRIAAAVPYGRDPATMLNGEATVGASLQAASATGGGWTATDTAVRLDLSGTLAGTLDKPRYAGTAALALQAEQAAGGATVLARPGLNLASTQAQAALAPTGLTAAGPIAGRAFAGAGTVDLGAQTLRLTGINLRGSGMAATGSGGTTADLSGALEADGTFSAADARGLADQMAPVGVTPELNAALRRALAAWRLEAPLYTAVFDNGPLTVRLGRPVRAAFRGGAVTLAASPNAPLAVVGRNGTAGALRLTAAGTGLPSLDLAVARYGIAPAGLSGSAHLTARGDVLPIEALDLAADLAMTPSPTGAVLRLSGCGPLSFSMLRAGPDPLLTGFKTEVCPSTEPLAVLGSGRWRAAARLNNAVSALPGAMAALSDGVVEVRLSGAGSAKPAGTIDVSAARVTDAMTPVRFTPLALSGRFNLADDRVAGRLGVALASRPGELVGLDVLHDLPTGEGRAVLEDGRIVFVSGGLQPGDIAPAAAPFASKADGPVTVNAQVGWGPAGVLGSARAATDGLAFNSPGGRLTGLKGAIEFPALMPVLVSAPDQHLTAQRLESAVPLTDIDLRFSLDGEALRLGVVKAGLAKGSVSLEPMVLPLIPGGTVTGKLNAAGVDLGEIVSSLNLADSVTIQATVEAALPFSLTPEGLRFANGRIAATGAGRLSIKRAALTGVATGSATASSDAPGAPPAAPVPINAVQDFAYQALENLAFDALDATVDSRPMGRLGVVFHLKGRNDPEKDVPARIGVIDLARGTAFDKPIPLPKGTPVDLTLDTSLNFDDLMAAYARIGRSDAVQP